MHILVFLTFNISLKKWDVYGLLDREIALYRQLVEDGLKVSLLTYGDEEDLDYQERLGGIGIIPVYQFASRPKSTLLRFLQSLILPFRLKAQLRQADIYKTNQMWGSWVAVVAKILYRKTLVIRCGYEQFRFGLLMKMPWTFKIFTYLNSFISYRVADKIVISSEIGKNFIIKFFKIQENKIKIQYNYVETQKFKPLPETRHPDRILFVGRLEKEKNLFALLDAIRQTPLTLDIVGEGRLKDELTSYIKVNKIKARLLGRMANSRLPETYNRYPVYILPSFCEGMPKTLLEAMSCGMAVIGSDIEGIHNIIKHKESGYLCDTTTESIRDAVREVMGDPSLRQRCGSRARRYIEEYHSLDSIVRQEKKIYGFDNENNKKDFVSTLQQETCC